MRHLPLAILLILLSRDSAIALDSFCAFERPGCDTPLNCNIPDPTPDYPWHSPQTIIPVYTSSIVTPWNSTQIPKAEFIIQLNRALGILNEQLGANLRLRYAGDSDSVAHHIPGAVLVRGGVCGSFGGAQIYTRRGSNSLLWEGALVVLYRYLKCPASSSQAPIDWTTNEQQGISEVDLVAALMHELGHCVYGIDHPDSETNPNCDDFGQLSMMRGQYGNRPAAWRTVKDWDAEVAQHWYTPRSQTAQIYNSFFVPAVTSWTVATVAPTLANERPLFRMGSMSQDSPDAVLAWMTNATGMELPGGHGTISAARVAVPTTVTPTASNGIRSPVAIANKPGTQEILMAYQSYWNPAQPPYVAGSDLFRLCFRRSLNGGVTYSQFATCDNSAATRRYGLTATYDPYSDAFLVGYIADSYLGPNIAPDNGGEDDIPLVALATVPANGSSTPYRAKSVIGGQSLTAPSVACNGSAQGCRVAWDDHIDNTLMWSEVGVDRVSGGATAIVAYQQGLAQFDTPSIAYNQLDDSFKLASCTGNDAIYSYSMSSGESQWTATGDIWNDTTSFVSAAVVSIWTLIPIIPVTAWFPRFI